MTDEAGILLRVSIFGFVAGVIYWFLSYEWLGTVALLLLGAGPGFAGLILVLEQRQRGGTGESRADSMRRLAGIPPQDPPGRKELAADDLGVLPLPTIWPLAASLGVAVLFTGLIYGLWLVILGLGLLLYATWGWLAAVNRENRYGRIQAGTEAPSPQSGPVSDPDPHPDPAEHADRAERSES
ncbi:MAG TPA: cytochrome c oxidase subunit 4 [Actinomycetes bacterium]|nr:cytochrome c oxidase subunit 4 [Actinomycetes bacterium]